MRIALDTNIMAYAEGLGDARRCALPTIFLGGGRGGSGYWCGFARASACGRSKCQRRQFSLTGKQ